MTFAAIVLQIIEITRVLPSAADAIAAWLGKNPDATPEQIAAELQTYDAAVAERRKAVADFNAGLQTP